MPGANQWQRAMRWAAAYFWAYVFMTTSAVMAAFHAYQQSVGPYAWVTAGQLALASVGGALGLGWASYIRKKNGLVMAAPTVVGALMCIFVTLWGGLGLFAAKSDTASAGRKAEAARNSLDRAKLKRLQDERAKLKARPIGQVAADLSNVRATPQYKASEGCEAEKITAAVTRTVCERYNLLEGELSQAKELARICSTAWPVSRPKAGSITAVSGQ